jgi:hypothetical protein
VIAAAPSTAAIFAAALILVFLAALAGVVFFVARAARDAERDELSEELGMFDAELSECRRKRLVEHRYLHSLEVAATDAGLPLPPRPDA